jgi:hypothetical protein
MKYSVLEPSHPQTILTAGIQGLNVHVINYEYKYIYENCVYFLAAMFESLIIKTPLIKSHEMKMGLQTYAIIIPIKFNSNNLNS